MKLILASNNDHKLREFREILSPLGVEIVSQSAVGCHEDPEETGDTFEENALIKAKAVLLATGRPAVADDSGLEVDALGGEPGVHSARYTGNHEDSDAARRQFLLKNLGDEQQRSARFVSAICCCLPNGDVLRSRGECRGRIAWEERGTEGFGYDSIFEPEGHGGHTMAELGQNVKNAISHRAASLRAFAEEWERYNADNK